MTQFLDRVVIVTGAAHGIGRDVALSFAREGARVAAIDIDEAHLNSLPGMSATGSVHPIVADVTRSEDVGRTADDILERWGQIDVLVNNAGGFKEFRLIEDITDEEWDQIIRLNLTSAFLCSKAVLPVMKHRKCGRIINLSSWVGRGGAVTVTSHYAAAKAGIDGFTRHLAREVGPFGITVNAVAPGIVATERFLGMRSPAEVANMVEAIPTKQLSQPHDVAAAILFFASDAAAQVTGTVLDVNGGALMA